MSSIFPASRLRRLGRAFPITLAAAAATGALAQQAAAPAGAGPSVYVQAAGAENGTRALQAGLTLPWSPSWRWNWGDTPVDGYWDIGAGRWRADAPTGRESITVLSFIPTFRFHTGGYASPWFIDAGIGATWASDHFVTTQKRFGTRFNFASHVGLGLQFGAARTHEVAVRIQHVSNGGYKKPNPGENFVQVRYALRF